MIDRSKLQKRRSEDRNILKAIQMIGVGDRATKKTKIRKKLSKASHGSELPGEEQNLVMMKKVIE